MKKINSIWVLAGALALGSCASSFLDREPNGSTVTQKQYEKLDNTLEGSMRGIYNLMYEMTSSNHDAFGKRAIDMYGDLLCGDMALTSYSYGWFYTDERGMTYTQRTSTVWSYYYKMLHNTNSVISTVSSQSEVLSKVAEYGLPNAYSKANLPCVIDATTKDTVYTYTENETKEASYYAQALTMRGFVLSQLLQLYTYTTSQLNGDFETLCLPVYDENNMDKSQPLSKISEVYTKLESDLSLAITYFDAFTENLTRTSKLEVNADVASGILAYSYLNKGYPQGNKYGDAYKEAYGNALAYAERVINSGAYTILPNNDVWTDGFNDVSSSCWMWGQDVTTETAGGLRSFFGQVDVHSYSYAWAGDTKAIDENLYKAIGEYDARRRWFSDGTDGYQSTFKYAPVRKFFSAKCPTSTASDDIDREWLSDNVFMRIESMYLIAAEAEYRLGEDDKAIAYLTAITDQRVDTAATAETAYAAFKSGLNHANLLSAIELNWRVELWGEGYGLMTFRRIAPETSGDTKRKRGDNHASDAGADIDPNAAKFIYQIPSGETSYNPNLDD